MSYSYAALLVAAGIGLVFVLLFRRLSTSVSIGEGDTEWLSRFSVAKYRPMDRLLSSSDFEFLRRQPGYVPAIEKQLRAERRRIFRRYLQSMRRDFDRLHRIAWFMVVYGQREQSELISTLRRLRWSFRYAYAAVQVRLAMHALAGAQINIRPIMEALETMHAQLQPAPSAA